MMLVPAGMLDIGIASIAPASTSVLISASVALSHDSRSGFAWLSAHPWDG